MGKAPARLHQRTVKYNKETGRFESVYTRAYIKAQVETWRNRTGLHGLMACVTTLIAYRNYYRPVPDVLTQEWFETDRWLHDVYGQYYWEESLEHWPGFVAYLWTDKCKWVEPEGPRGSWDLTLMIRRYLEKARKWDFTDFEKIDLAKLRLDIKTKAAEEGLYGDFCYDMTPEAYWYSTRTMDPNEWETFQEETRIRTEEYREEWRDEQYQLVVDIQKDHVEISVPALEDIIRIPALFGKTEEEEMQRKKAMYEHILQSPIPKAAQKLQRIAKLTDDIEDYGTTAAAAGYIGMKAMQKWAPFAAKKIATRAIPLVGWFLTGLDLLNLATASFASASNPLGAKRAVESIRRFGRRRGRAGLRSAERVRAWKPTAGTLLEALQASEDATGYGVRLGPIMGMISEEFWGTAKFLRGDTEEVRVSYPWERPGTMESKAYKALGSAGEVLPALYALDKKAYMATMIVAATAANQGAKESFHPEWDKVYNGVKHLQLLYQPPTNPLTRKVLSEMGFDPDEPVGYLGIDGPKMPTVEELGFVYEGSYIEDLYTAMEEEKDSWFTYFFNCELGDFTDSFLAMLAYPDDEVIYHRTGELDALVVTAKMGIIPPKGTPDFMLSGYCNLIQRHIEQQEKWPPEYLLKRWANTWFGGWDTKCPPTKEYKA